MAWWAGSHVRQTPVSRLGCGGGLRGMHIRVACLSGVSFACVSAGLGPLGPCRPLGQLQHRHHGRWLDVTRAGRHAPEVLGPRLRLWASCVAYAASRAYRSSAPCSSWSFCSSCCLLLALVIILRAPCVWLLAPPERCSGWRCSPLLAP